MSDVHRFEPFGNRRQYFRIRFICVIETGRIDENVSSTVCLIGTNIQKRLNFRRARLRTMSYIRAGALSCNMDELRNELV